MKTITFIVLYLSLGGCAADEEWMHPRHAAYSPPPAGPNQAQARDERLQRAINEAIDEQETLDSTPYATRK